MDKILDRQSKGEKVKKKAFYPLESLSSITELMSLQVRKG